MATFSFVRQKMGVRKPRLTGGEPLLRTNLSDLIGDLTAIRGVRDVALTTNGVSPADRPGDRLATFEQV